KTSRGVANRYEETRMFTIVALLFTLTLIKCCVLNVNSEQIITLAQLARRIPCRRNNRPVHVSTIHRWRNPGIRGVRLDCVRVGGMWCTSLQAFARWVEQLTAVKKQGEPNTPTTRPDVEGTKRDAEVERQLDDLGI